MKYGSLTIQAEAGLRAGRSSSRIGSIVSQFSSQVSPRWPGQRVFKDISYHVIINTLALLIVITSSQVFFIIVCYSSSLFAHSTLWGSHHINCDVNMGCGWEKCHMWWAPRHGYVLLAKSCMCFYGWMMSSYAQSDTVFQAVIIYSNLIWSR